MGVFENQNVEQLTRQSSASKMDDLLRLRSVYIYQVRFKLSLLLKTRKGIFLYILEVYCSFQGETGFTHDKSDI